ncbi:MAG: signal recognition particle-docking protein FtsY [Desulfobulbaceae bacterium]|nr:signal recognition particle-docking protein FtsY [Desulfobulbaceae bacterium]
MLAWFKKKFGKQQDVPQTVAAEQLEEQLAVNETPQTADDTSPAPADDAALETALHADADPAPTAPPTEDNRAALAPTDSTEDAEEDLDGTDAASAVEAVETVPTSTTEHEAEASTPLFAAEQGTAVVPAPAAEEVESKTAAVDAGELAAPLEKEAVVEELTEGLPEAEVFPDPADEAAEFHRQAETAADVGTTPATPEEASVAEAPSPAPEPSVLFAEEGTPPSIDTEAVISGEPPEETSLPDTARLADSADYLSETERIAPPAEEDGSAPVSSYTQEKPAAKSMFRRLQDRLGKTRSSFVYQLDRLFMGEKEISQELFDQLEELLITADLGVSTAMELLDEARKRVKRDQLSDPLALKNILKEEMLAYITASDQPAELVMPEQGPFVIMVVGVNGVGKTTTIGKIAAKFVRSEQSVLLIAGDTFRAAAIDQLKIWGERVGVEVFAQKPGADPASVVFDGIDHGIALNKDVILIDTAGRLHTSVNLMEELKKMQRVMGKRLPGAPHEVLQVLDATTGQNGIAQAKLFHEAVGVSGLALTKLDGTAKGGIVANICRELKIPVRFIGIGEQLDDLRDFNATEFVDALFAETVK